jgi:hypothetical protein
MAGTGTPPVSPNFNVPRYSANDPADYWDQTNGVTDAFDAQAAKRGAIVNADIAANAAIVKTKLAPLAINDSDVDPAAAIQETKLSLASDAAPGVASRRTLGAGPQQAAAGNDPRFGGMVPIGGLVTYAGLGDPPEANFVCADGRLIDRTVYVEFFNRVGHSYNGGVDPGSNKVKIPDKRGRALLGALTMNTQMATPPSTDNTRAQAATARGVSGGENAHTSTNAEMPVHAHGGGTGADSPDHAHSGSTSTDSPDHAHYNNASYAQAANYWGGGPPPAGSMNWLYTPVSGAAVGGATARHAHSFGTGGASARHAHGINNDGGGAAHNNVGPFEADCILVRIA